MFILVAKAIGAVIASYIFLQALLRLTQDSNEPPVMATAIPFISPILGMKKRNARYYNYLRDTYSQPIFTLRLPFTRLYIVTATSLIPSVQRQSRVLSFNPIQIKAVTNFASPSKEALDLINLNIDNEKGFIHGFLKAVYPTLTGTMLDMLNQRTVDVILAEFDKFAAKGCSPTIVDLYKWMDQQITYVTTDSIYGPHNPLRDPENFKAWHVFEAKTMTLVMGILPSIFAADAIKARAFLSKKYQNYFAQDWHLEGSDYIKRRYAYLCERGLSADDVAKIELTGVFPLIGNTIPTAFWLVYRIFSSPIVLEDCRREVLQAVSEQDGICTIDASYIKDHCPILSSTYQEVLRFHGMGTSVRVALEDHLLEGKYMIKKGGMVMISGRVQHSDAKLWGDDFDKFCHKRFLKTPEGKKRHNPVAFRGFGGGSTLCPGRHFATTEILLFATLLILRFDIRLADGLTEWPMPPTDQSSQAAAVDQPGHDIRIELLPKPSQKWRVIFSNKMRNKTEIVAEDIHTE
ncbi:cytochrome P450 [Nemania sp. FL0916]|nr:cytochrome P450 [Nemania sp. FL0916]